MKKSLGLWILVVGFGLGSLGLAQGPALINYQGRLLQDTNLFNGQVGITVRLYDDPVAGALLLEDSNTVNVVDGLYATLIGDGLVSGTMTGALAAAAVYLEVAINDTVFLPRERLVSAGYAVQAADVPGNIFWRMGGNADLAGAERVLGTRDNNNFELRVNSQTALRLEPAAGTPIWVAGHSNNSVGWNSDGAAIGGGGQANVPNTIAVNAPLSTIAGGAGNRIGDGSVMSDKAFVGGGYSNMAIATAAMVGGGLGNVAYGVQAAVVGGENNRAYGSYATAVGGRRNLASNNYAAVSGGVDNRAEARAAAIGGGQRNQVLAEDGVVAGGNYNRIQAAAYRAAIGGGVSNQIVGGNAVIAGGLQNQVSGWNATIAGGAYNIASNNYAVVLGGYANQAAGDYAMAAGWMARAAHMGSFVWADPDAVASYFSTTATNQFLIRARGGVGINTNGPFTDSLTVSGSVRADAFIGDGAGLTALNGASLADGSVTGSKIQNGSITVEDVATNAFWNADGNVGTTPGTHFLGTRDPIPFEVRANAARALYIDGNSNPPNLIGGQSNNYADVGVVGASIGGGGDPAGAAPNRVSDNYGTVGGGLGNRAGDGGGTVANASYAAVLGGHKNSANSACSAVVGGMNNFINDGNAGAFIGCGSNNLAQGPNSVVVGGRQNYTRGQNSFIGAGYQNAATNHGAVIGGGLGNYAYGLNSVVGAGNANNAEGMYAAVLGGMQNLALGGYAAIAGGRRNEAHADYSFVGGGLENDVEANGTNAFIGGGMFNSAAGFAGVVAGGSNNAAVGSYSFIGGGSLNTASGSYSVVAGGYQNKTGPNAQYSTVGGGISNQSLGPYSTVPGGEANTAIGTNSFAAGRRAKALHKGAFVWADSQNADFNSTTNDQFAIRATNGVWISQAAGDTRPVPIGTHYRDNAIVAWAKVYSSGAITEDFNVDSVTKVAVGAYMVNLPSAFASASAVIPVATVELDAQPSSAGAVRFISVDQRSATNFNVYINDGTFAPVDTEFMVVVTGR